MLKQKRYLSAKPSTPNSSPLGTTFKYLIITLMSIVLVSKVTTSTLFFNYPLPSRQQIQANFLPKAMQPATPTLLLTPAQLALYDGRHSPKGIYLGIDGEIYDVTGGDAYQPGGSESTYSTALMRLG